MSKRKIYVIVGPTASGKSALALQMAQTLNGVVVNADSMQIYRDLTILSARPTPDEMQHIPHLLYGYADSFYENNVQDWLQKAASIAQSAENPVFVGGTGLYISALINGLSPIPDVDPVIRERVRDMPLEEVKARVIECAATDSQRLRRALEVQLSTGKPLSYFQRLPKVPVIEADFQVLFLNPPRAKLYEQCNNRFIKMIQKGAIEEVKNLIRLHATGGVTKAIGVPEIVDYLSGRLSQAEMIQKAQTATRHYAKRQVTWFRHQLTNAVEIAHPHDFKFIK